MQRSVSLNNLSERYSWDEHVGALGIDKDRFDQLSDWKRKALGCIARSVKRISEAQDNEGGSVDGKYLSCCDESSDGGDRLVQVKI
ncbi:hypothetical protein GUITHDRAFT_113539 [Guillardia theta CCMP2712]|uniref:Uncharacterized protein n=1 Tax=Guillardia theta (strain CCMP2712) TaxID=905079 RepID=L1IVP7_GUITC|nr:hypothetical protein GUITHDRAFT_113539 [Guillardia theta CCMP2712]EKX40296.1 hypothetical protein GUITHDRAFT_113539 [Guillardia theta CCMP2712]|eukprot:XP_005827276.1 hypothetical protein GUITHDRAFT_113539 [Guillardia theta CCMP2712]